VLHAPPISFVSILSPKKIGQGVQIIIIIRRLDNVLMLAQFYDLNLHGGYICCCCWMRRWRKGAAVAGRSRGRLLVGARRLIQKVPQRRIHT
jgi:hypothetical protein